MTLEYHFHPGTVLSHKSMSSTQSNPKQSPVSTLDHLPTVLVILCESYCIQALWSTPNMLPERLYCLPLMWWYVSGCKEGEHASAGLRREVESGKSETEIGSDRSKLEPANVKTESEESERRPMSFLGVPRCERLQLLLRWVGSRNRRR